MNKYAAESRSSQQERKLRRACTDKVRYATRQEAYQKGQNLYRCKHCDGWHRTGSLATLIYDLKKGVPRG